MPHFAAGQADARTRGRTHRRQRPPTVCVLDDPQWRRASTRHLPRNKRPVQVARAPRPGFEPGTYRLTALWRAEPSNFAVFARFEIAVRDLPRSPLTEVGWF